MSTFGGLALKFGFLGKFMWFLALLGDHWTPCGIRLDYQADVKVVAISGVAKAAPRLPVRPNFTGLIILFLGILHKICYNA